jgi:hypothetical protein
VEVDGGVGRKEAGKSGKEVVPLELSLCAGERGCVSGSYVVQYGGRYA